VQCRALRGAAASALVLLRPHAFHAAPPAGEEGWVAFFDARATHIAVADRPLGSSRPFGALRLGRLLHIRNVGGGASARAAARAAAAATAASREAAYGSAAARLRRYDGMITSDALGAGLARLTAAGLTGWAAEGDPEAAATAAQAAALQKRAAGAARGAPRDGGDALVGDALAAWALHAAAADLAALGPSAHSRPRRRYCSSLPGPALSAGLPVGAAADGDGMQAPAGEPPVDPGARGDVAGQPLALHIPVALCAAVRDGAAYVDEWLRFHLSAGVARAYVHDDGSTDDTPARLAAWAAPQLGHYVTPLAALHGATRFGIAERTAAGGWSGQREVLGRCLTHALLDGMAWLLSADLDEYFMPRRPAASLGEALQAMAVASCVTVKRHGSFRPPGAVRLLRELTRRLLAPSSVQQQ